MYLDLPLQFHLALCFFPSCSTMLTPGPRIHPPFEPFPLLYIHPSPLISFHPLSPSPLPPLLSLSPSRSTTYHPLLSTSSLHLPLPISLPPLLLHLFTLPSLPSLLLSAFQPFPSLHLLPLRLFVSLPPLPFRPQIWEVVTIKLSKPIIKSTLSVP